MPTVRSGGLASSSSSSASEIAWSCRVIAKDADAGAFLLNGIPEKTMPADYLDKLATQQSISYNHLLATLEGRMNWRGMDIVLTGIAPEVCPPGQKKPPTGVKKWGDPMTPRATPSA